MLFLSAKSDADDNTFRRNRGRRELSIFRAILTLVVLLIVGLSLKPLWL